MGSFFPYLCFCLFALGVHVLSPVVSCRLRKGFGFGSPLLGLVDAKGGESCWFADLLPSPVRVKSPFFKRG